jgi:hypothetical protein
MERMSLNVIGEGMSFLYSKRKIDQGHAAHLPPDFAGLAVVFDTFQGGKSTSHSLKLITGSEVSRSQSVIGGCTGDFRNHKAPYFARIVYKNQTVIGMKNFYYLFIYLFIYFFVCLFVYLFVFLLFYL